MVRTAKALVGCLLAWSAAGCGTTTPMLVTGPSPLREPWPPQGVGAGAPWSEPEPVLERLVEPLRASGWDVRAVRSSASTAADASLAPLVVVATRADGPAAWILVPTDGAAPADAAAWPIAEFDVTEPPDPIWFVELGPEIPGLAVIAERPSVPGAAEPGPTHAAYRLASGADGLAADLLWEALEPADAVAAVDLDGSGATDVVALRWYDACPDPMLAASGTSCAGASAGRVCSAEESAVRDSCLIVRVWADGDGVPQTYRIGRRPQGGLSSTGDVALDRAVGLLELADCRYLDLRRMTVRRETGLRVAGEEDELIEELGCGPDSATGEPTSVPLVALLDVPDGRRLPAGEVVPLRAPPGAEPGRWVDGYLLLEDLDGDGLRDWLWAERSDRGTRYVVTDGADRRVTAGGFFVGPDGDVVDRLVVAPPGGRAVLDTLDWQAAPAPAAILGVRVEPASGASRIERIVVPLEFQ